MGIMTATMEAPPQTEDEQVVDLLLRTADAIEDGRWCRGTFAEGKDGSAHCASGWLRLQAGGQVVRFGGDDGFTVAFPQGFGASLCVRATHALQNNLFAEYGEATTIYRWNDAQRDKRKVVRFIRRTARKLAST